MDDYEEPPHYTDEEVREPYPDRGYPHHDYEDEEVIDVTMTFPDSEAPLEAIDNILRALRATQHND